METKIAVIGDRSIVSAFKTVGFDGFEPQNKGQVASLLAELSKKGYGIIFITEQLALLSEGSVDEYKGNMLPAIILIPGRQGSMGIGIDNIHSNVEKAVGADIVNR